MSADSESIPVSFDIYIRMNEDDEKDYCFNVKPTSTFKDLFVIFKKLPLNLSPGIFYNRDPIGFKISTAPGLLTPEGGLLFGDKAGIKKFTKPVSNDALIKDKVWPGQLILPVWEERTFLKYSIISVLLTWLYTDLPDFISPTPGICATNQLVRLIWYLLTYYADRPHLANNIYNDMFAPTGIVGQLLFFAFHLFKVGLIYLLLATGIINPYSITREKLPTIERDDLIEMGWTGTKKAVLYEYSETYRKFKIEQAGGIMKAHQEGTLAKLRKGCVELGEGEGYNTPFTSYEKLPSREYEELLTDLSISPETSTVLKKMEDSKKYKLSLELITYQNSLFAEYVKDFDEDQLVEESKNLRKFGLLYFGSDFLRNLYEKRAELGDGDVKEE